MLEYMISVLTETEEKNNLSWRLLFLMKIQEVINSLEALGKYKLS